VNAPDTARLFFDHVVRYHGLPSTIVSDRDARFTSLFWRSLFDLFGTKISLSTAFHPQSDGQTERTNRTLEEMLRAYVSPRQDEWDKFLPAVEFAYNNSTQASTKFSPFYLVNGQHPRTPSDFINTRTLNESTVPAASEFADTIAKTIQTATEHLRKAQERQTRYANQKRRDETLKIGDQILLSTGHLHLTHLPASASRKLAAKYIGPYPIESVISPVAYKLTLPPTLRIHPVFHVSRLKPYHSSNDPSRQDSRPDPIEVDGEPEFEVETILDKRIRRKKVQYLVKWAGYPVHDATWEPLDNLQNAMDMVKQYEREATNRTRN
jgi:hypothetical protein